MMRKSVWLIVLFLMFQSCGTGKSYHTETYKGHPILVGSIDERALRQDPYKQWFTENYNEYIPDSRSIEELKKIDWKAYRVDIYMGTWCPDSREHVPHFLKIARSVGLSPSQIRIFALRRHYKDDPLAAGKNIIRVPTFIIYKNGKEQARIIEYPMESLEKDLLRIGSGQKYIHDYQKS